MTCDSLWLSMESVFLQQLNRPPTLLNVTLNNYDSLLFQSIMYIYYMSVIMTGWLFISSMGMYIRHHERKQSVVGYIKQ
jgi:hypothetical protein